MDKLINLISKQLPAFWGLLLSLPLIKENLPLLYDFSLISNTNLIIVITGWLLLYEILIYHILLPILFSAFSLLIFYYLMIIIPSKIFPSISIIYLKRKKDKKKTSEEEESLSNFLIKFVKSIAPQHGNISNNEAIEIALLAGKHSKYYTQDDKNLDGDLFPFLTITSFVFSILYLYLAPNLSILHIDSLTASIILFVSSVLLGSVGYFLSNSDTNKKLHASFLSFTERS